MAIEVKSLGWNGVYATAQMETSVIINEVLKGNLPHCDLGDLRHVGDKTMIERVAVENRVTLISEHLKDESRHIFVAHDAGTVVGRIGLRLVESEGKAIIYGLYVTKKHRGTSVVLDLLGACFDELDKLDPDQKLYKLVRTSRYEASESKRPVLTKLMNLVNRAVPNSVSSEMSDWKGNSVISFCFSRSDAKDLLCEVGREYLRFLQH